MRLFVSIDLPDALTAPIEVAHAQLQDTPGLTLVDPTQTHVTLKFLGDVDTDRFPALDDAVETAVDAANVGPFEVTVSGYGVFPNLDSIRVVWAGIDEGTEEMTRLHDALERETTAIGFDAERHAFTPHVTLGRVKDARGTEAIQRVVCEQSPTIGRFRVDAVRLTESTLSADGSRYRTVSRFAL